MIVGDNLVSLLCASERFSRIRSDESKNSIRDAKMSYKFVARRYKMVETAQVAPFTPDEPVGFNRDKKV